jgi:hypothetical protein
VNVDDISKEKVPTDFTVYDRLDWVFIRQRDLSEKYLAIELANGLRNTSNIPVNLDDRFGQAQLKDYFWRITEELTEAVDASREHPDIPSHILEELADALHFLVEAYILSDISADDLTGPYNGEERFNSLFTGPSYSLEDGAYEVIHTIGKASNCLKQRPWKCTHQLVDRKKYREALIPAICSLMSIFQMYLTPEMVFEMYWKKSLVNSFRIRSNY